MISKGSENFFKQGRFKRLRFSSVGHASEKDKKEKRQTLTSSENVTALGERKF